MHFLQASSSAVTVNAAELAELNQNLKISKEELDSLNKRFDEAQGKPNSNIRAIYRNDPHS